MHSRLAFIRCPRREVGKQMEGSGARAGGWPENRKAVRVRLGGSLRTHRDKDVERPKIRDTNQELQPWRQEEGGRTESEGGDIDWLGHFCPQGSAFLGG